MEPSGIREYLYDVLQDKDIGLETIALVCDVISADCRWNMWFLETVKTAENDLNSLDALELYQDITNECRVIISNTYHQKEMNHFNIALRKISQRLAEMYEK